MEINVDSYIPVIGVIANFYPEEDEDNSTKAYIWDMIICWIEENGGKVLPIFPWYNEEEINLILKNVNGVLMQGGVRNLDLNKKFEKMNKYIFDKVIKENLGNGNESPFPLIGICQGLELIYSLLYNSVNILSNFDSMRYYIPLNFDENIVKSSKMFCQFSDEDLNNLSTKNCTLHYHHLGVDFYSDRNPDFKIADEYKIVNLRILTQGNDRNGKEFIANSEDSQLNIFTTIFHPESMPYEFSLSLNDDVFTPVTYSVSNKIALAFIDLCKKNRNRLKNTDNFHVIEGNRVNKETVLFESIPYDLAIFQK